METMNLNKFGFTGNIDESIFNKVSRFTELEKMLNEKLIFTKYTKELQEIVFVYIALKSELIYKVEDFTKFRRKNKIVEIGINIEYSELLQTDEQQTLEILAETYLKGIEKYLIGRKDFDGSKFYADVKLLFTEHGIIKLKGKS